MVHEFSSDIYYFILRNTSSLDASIYCQVKLIIFYGRREEANEDENHPTVSDHLCSCTLTIPGITKISKSVNLWHPPKGNHNIDNSDTKIVYL